MVAKRKRRRELDVEVLVMLLVEALSSKLDLINNNNKKLNNLRRKLMRKS